MTEWMEIESLHDAGKSVLIVSRNGNISIAPPIVAKDLAIADKVAMAKAGAWFDAGYIPTHWMPLPAPPPHTGKEN